MAIAKSADGQAAAATISLASTGIAAGDLVIVHAYRSGSTTVPSSPGANWTDIATSAGANTNSRRIGYRIIQAGDNLATIVGTWTNATAIQFIGLTGYNAAAPIGGNASGGTNTSTLTTPTVTLTDSSGVSWVVAFAGSKSTNANTVTLSSTTDEGSSQGALNLATGRNVTSYTSRNYSATVNASGNRMDAVEVLASNAQNPQPSSFSMTWTGDTPTVAIATTVTPSAFAMTWTGATPTVSKTDNVSVAPSALALIWTGSTPTVSAPAQSSPSAFAMTLTGSTPAIALPVAVSPSALALAWTGATPDVQVSSGSAVAIAPDPFAMTWVGDTPTVTASGQTAPVGGAPKLPMPFRRLPVPEDESYITLI